jgi:hypothetical protein
VRRVVAVNAYNFAGDIARSSLIARFVVSGVLTPGVGAGFARMETKPLMRAIMNGGVVDAGALRADCVDELARVGHRPGYPTVARAVFRNLASLIAARSHYPEVKAPIHLVY